MKELLMLKHLLVLSAATLIASTACKKDDKKESDFVDEGPQWLATLKEKRGNALPIETAAIAIRMDGIADEFGIPEEDGETEEPEAEVETEESCQDKEIKTHTIFEGKGKTVRVQTNHSTSDTCAEELKAAAKQEAADVGFAQASIQKSYVFYGLLICQNDVSIKSATVSDEVEALIAACVPVSSSFFGSNSTEAYEYNLEGNEVLESSSSLESHGSNSDKDGRPCAMSSDDACSTGTFFKFSGVIEFSTYSYITPNTLVRGESPSRWYESGTWDVQLNDWEGTVTAAGSATPPTYSISNGTDTHAASFSDFEALRKSKPLKHRFPKNLIQAFGLNKSR